MRIWEPAIIMVRLVLMNNCEFFYAANNAMPRPEHTLDDGKRELTKMSDAATWPIAAGKNRDHEAISVPRGAFLLALLGLMLGLAFSIWTYLRGEDPLFVIAILGSV